MLDWDEADAGASRARVVGLLAAEPGLVLHVLPGRGGMTALGVAIDGGAKQLVELLVEVRETRRRHRLSAKADSELTRAGVYFVTMDRIQFKQPIELPAWRVRRRRADLPNKARQGLPLRIV